MPNEASRTRRHDPNRRDRIIEATLDLIAEIGTEGVTHRKIAEKADVPLGSMTYHFSGMDDLLSTALTAYAQQVTVQYSQHLSHAKTPQEARSALVDYLFSPFWIDMRNVTLMTELYSYVTRHPPMRGRVQQWLADGWGHLDKHFDSATVRALDSFIEGVTLHRAIDPTLMDRDDVYLFIKRLSS